MVWTQTKHQKQDQQMKTWLTLAATLGLLSGCAATNPELLEPIYLQDGAKYEMKGVNGWRPLSKLNFSEYSAKIDTGWTTGESATLFSNVMADEVKTRKVSINQSSLSGLSTKLRYKQRCEAQGARFPIWKDIVFVDGVEITHTVAGALTLDDQLWQLQDNQLTDGSGNRFEVLPDRISYNGKLIAELQLDVPMGGLSSASFIWLDEEVQETTLFIAATLATYLTAFDPLTCGEDQDN